MRVVMGRDVVDIDFVAPRLEREADRDQSQTW